MELRQYALDTDSSILIGRPNNPNSPDSPDSPNNPTLPPDNPNNPDHPDNPDNPDNPLVKGDFNVYNDYSAPLDILASQAIGPKHPCARRFKAEKLTYNPQNNHNNPPQDEPYDHGNKAGEQGYHDSWLIALKRNHIGKLQIFKKHFPLKFIFSVSSF